MELKTIAKGVGVETNNEVAEVLDFGIGDPSVIIEILRNRLYSNPIQTLVQEYISNGRDASREAKSVIPLVITLPSKIDPVFKVRDFGVGISPKQMREVFVLYGKSTKRGSNQMTGGFGIGAKSAWAYTDSFTIVSYLNGICRTYIAHIGQNQNGMLEMISEEETTEANGTEIQIGVHEKDRKAFILAAYRSTMFWKQKPTFQGIIEEEIPSFYKEMNPVLEKDNWSIFKSYDLNSFMDGTQDFSSYKYYQKGGVVFVVDGIPYKLQNKFLELENVKKSYSYLNESMVLAIHVGNGDVEVSASREAIADSQFSQESINTIMSGVIDSINSQVEAELSKAKNFQEYIAIHHKLNEALNDKLKTTRTFGKTNYSIDGRFCLQSDILEHVSIMHYELNEQRTRTVVSSSLVKNLYLTRESHFIFQDIPEGTTKVRERIRAFLNKDTQKQVYLIQSEPKGSKEQLRQFIEEISATPLSSLALPEVAKTKTTRVSNKGKLCIHTLSCETSRSRYYPSIGRTTEHIPEDELNTEDTILYIELENGSIKLGNNHAKARIIKYLNDRGYGVIGVSSSVKKKITKYDNYVDFSDFVSKINVHIPLNENQKNSIRKKMWKGSYSFSKLIPFLDEIQDKQLKELLSIDKEITSLPSEELNDAVKSYYEKEIKAVEKEMNEKNKLSEGLSSLYPLVGSVSYYGDKPKSSPVLKDLVDYINFKYKANAKLAKKK